MKTKNLFLITIALISFGLNQAFGQWTVYKCDVLPTEMPNSMWEKGDFIAGINEGDTAVFTSVMDDPDISGNRMIKIEELEGNAKESWSHNWEAVSAVGITLVYRTKPSPGLLALPTEGDGKKYQYSFISPRNGSIREDLEWEYPGTLELKNTGDGTPIDFPSVDWQIFRLTIKDGVTALYVNENPDAVISGTNVKTNSENGIKLGNNSTNTVFGSLVDWVIWDISGAYAPGEGTALPSDLTGLPGGGTSSARYQLYSKNLSAFPNPITGATTIRYKVENTSMTRVDIYDISGKLVRNLFNEVQVAGQHEILFSADGVPAGMYYCRAQSDNSVSVVKMIVQ